MLVEPIHSNDRTGELSDQRDSKWRQYGNAIPQAVCLPRVDQRQRLELEGCPYAGAHDGVHRNSGSGELAVFQLQGCREHVSKSLDQSETRSIRLKVPLHLDQSSLVCTRDRVAVHWLHDPAMVGPT